jgi:iron(III) transport system permease protein
MPAVPVVEYRPNPGGPGLVRARRAPAPSALLAASIAVVVVLVSPLVFLLVEAHGAGVSTTLNLVFRSVTASLLWNTVRMTVVVTVLCAVIGTSAAWLVERTDLPGRRLWAVLVVVPLAIPDFVVSFGWASLSTWVHGFRGAVLVMTLAVYPLVYLPVAASFRNADPGQEEVARSLGVGRLQTFWRVTLGQARGAILGGCLLVALVLLAEYGAFEILGYQTFTTEIFTEFSVSFSVPTASALSLVLVLLSLLLLGGETAARGRGRHTRSGPLAQRVGPRHRLGRATVPVLAGFLVLVGLALGVPVGSAVYWILRGGTPPGTPRCTPAPRPRSPP